MDETEDAAPVAVTMLVARKLDEHWRPQGWVGFVPADLAETLIADGAARVATDTDRALANV